MNNSKLLLADCFDLLSGLLIYNAELTDVLNWIYMILLIASLLLGIGLKIWSALKDGKLTSEEAEEIRKEIESAADKAKAEADESKERPKTSPEAQKSDEQDDLSNGS